MSWFRLDDQFHSQPKVIAAGNAAIGLYCRMGTYCADKLTDGFVADAIAKSLGTRKELGALTVCPIPDTRSLLSKVDGGYLMRDYLEYNPSREKVLAEREAAKARMRGNRSGEHRKNERQNIGRSSAPPDPDPLGVTDIYNSSSIHSGRTDEVLVQALEDFAQLLAEKNAKPLKRLKYAQTVVETGHDHYAALMAMRKIRPDATAGELAEAYMEGGWPTGRPAPSGHSPSCECGGTGWIQIDDGSAAGYVTRCTNVETDATIHELRATS